jgi:cytochrome c oxidase subunit 2
MGVALVAAVAVVTAATVWAVAAKVWWFPAPISELARLYDDHFVFTLALCGFFFVLGQALLIYVVLRGRKNRREPGTGWVWAVMGAMVLLDVGLSRGASRVWTEQMMEPAPADALRVEVTGQQFAWNVRYAGPDGRFGRTDPRLVNDSAGNPLGLDPKDPAVADDLVRATLVVPAGRPVEVLLRSKDVLHSFFVRELRIKQDAVPGMLIRVKFTAEKAGRYEICCAELCGLGHHRMRSFLEVVEEQEFEKRLRD